MQQREHLKKPTVVRLTRNSAADMETEDLLPLSQEPTTCSYHEEVSYPQLPCPICSRSANFNHNPCYASQAGSTLQISQITIRLHSFIMSSISVLLLLLFLFVGAVFV
jgi:hypothetical protein